MRPKLIIFDLDGVIADTEPLHREAKVRLLKQFSLGDNVDLDGPVGKPSSEFWNAILAESGKELSAAELEKMQYNSILELLVENNVQLSKGLKGVLELLHRLEIPCALCSSSELFYVEKVLTHFSIKDMFSVIVAGDEVKARKPAPDCYRLVLEKAGVTPGAAYAVEDTAAGVKAAVSAGIDCIGYRNATSGNQDLSEAFMQIDSLGELVPWVGGFFTGCCSC